MPTSATSGRASWLTGAAAAIRAAHR